MTAAGPAGGGGVVFLHGDAPAPTPTPPPAGSAAAAPPPTFGSSIADANAPNRGKNQRLPGCRASITATAAAAAAAAAAESA